MIMNSTIATMLEGAFANKEVAFTRCGECKARRKSSDGKYRCSRLSNITVRPDFFCAYGEKAEQKIREKENVR